jgi:hypothetical protein
MKKTNKPNPLTFFRKANEARAKLVKKSLKKAQDDIQVPYAPKPQVSYWFDDPNKRAAYDASSRKRAARIRDNNSDPEAEREYGRLSDSYSPNGPNLDLPNEMKKLNAKYPFYEGFYEKPFIGGDNNKGWDKVRADKPAKDKRYKEMDPNSEYMGEPEWKKKGGAIKRKKK